MTDEIRRLREMERAFIEQRHKFLIANGWTEKRSWPSLQNVRYVRGDQPVALSAEDALRVIEAETAAPQVAAG